MQASGGHNWTGGDRFELDAEQLEWVVNEVVRRLLAGAGGEPGGPSGGGASSDFELRDRVVTAIALEGKLDGVSRVLIPGSAVVTPAARDLLNDRQIELVRS